MGIRLLRFDGKNWRASYNSLILLEHLLTHGPESVADEFRSEKTVIEEMESFQYIDEKGSLLILPFLGFVFVTSARIWIWICVSRLDVCLAQIQLGIDC